MANDLPDGAITADMAGEGGEEMSFGDVGKALGEALMREEGVGERRMSDEANELIESVTIKDQPAKGKAKAKEAAAEGAADEFVHEPTGKKFATEADLYKYDSSYNTERLGKQNKALEEKLAALENRLNEPRQEPQKPMSEKDIKKLLFKSLPENQLDDPAVGLVFEGIDNASELLRQDYSRAIDLLRNELTTLRGQLEETAARSKSGVPADKESEILSKHPSLAKLPFGERMAVVKDMIVSANGVERRPAAGAAPKASDYVEGSAASPLSDSEDDDDRAFEKKFDKLSEKDQVGALGRLFAATNPLRGRSVEDLWG